MSKRKDDTPAGFKCECGAFHQFAAYVYGHWHIVLVHKCEHCKRRHEIEAGKATLLPRRAA